MSNHNGGTTDTPPSENDSEEGIRIPGGLTSRRRALIVSLAGFLSVTGLMLMPGSAHADTRSPSDYRVVDGSVYSWEARSGNGTTHRYSVAEVINIRNANERHLLLSVWRSNRPEWKRTVITWDEFDSFLKVQTTSALSLSPKDIISIIRKLPGFLRDVADILDELIKYADALAEKAMKFLNESGDFLKEIVGSTADERTPATGAQVAKSMTNTAIEGKFKGWPLSVRVGVALQRITQTDPVVATEVSRSILSRCD